MRRSIVVAIVLAAALTLQAVVWAAGPGEERSGLDSLAHPSFRAGQDGQVYYRGTPASPPAEVATGPVTLNWQALYQAQLRVYQGQDTWRLDPVQVARQEGAILGFDPWQDTYTLISRVDVQKDSGTGEAQVLVQHLERAYIVQLIQPFGPGPGMMWTVNSVREITSANVANRIARQAWIAFRYRGPNGPALAAWWNQDYVKPTAPVTSGRPGRVYYVQPGDTLWAISVKNGVTLYRLIQLNPNVDANALWVGQIIIVQASEDASTTSQPSGNPSQGGAAGRTIHIVEPGDTLYQLALRYGASVQAIMQSNGITDANTLWVGQRLVIP
jgi:LysM repeat protein